MFVVRRAAPSCLDGTEKVITEQIRHRYIISGLNILTPYLLGDSTPSCTGFFILKDS